MIEHPRDQQQKHQQQPRHQYCQHRKVCLIARTSRTRYIINHNKLSLLALFIAVAVSLIVPNNQELVYVIGSSIDVSYNDGSSNSQSISSDIDNGRKSNKEQIDTTNDSIIKNGDNINITPKSYQDDEFVSSLSGKSYDGELDNEYEDEEEDNAIVGSAVEDHPDPNEEDYPNMIYVGRIDYETGKRLSAHHDNSIRYIFGTAFDEDHKNILEIDLHHRSNTSHIHDIPDANGAELRTIEEIQREREKQRRHGNVTHAKIVGPRPFGYVETNDVDGGITPAIPVNVEPFFMDATPVTNKEFAKFVQSTYYETEAEHFGWSYVLSSFLSKKDKERIGSEVEVDPDAEHWVAVPGAYWRQPEGMLSSYKYREHHPVVHVSHRDAAEYCAWVGKRLPGEREWEAAARAGQWYNKTPSEQINNRYMFIWQDIESDTVENDTANVTKLANLWGAGEFPHQNLAEDGWRGTSPVKTFPPNVIGLYDMTGNVWEWMRGGKLKSRIVRGASYVDTITGIYNHAATLGARSVIHGTTTTGNVGFRCCKSPKKRRVHHYVWHDEIQDGKLAIHDQYGKQHMVPESGWEDQLHATYDHHYHPDDDEDEDEIQGTANQLVDSSTTNKKMMKRMKREKRKVIKKYERLSNEL